MMRPSTYRDDGNGVGNGIDNGIGNEHQNNNISTNGNSNSNSNENTMKMGPTSNRADDETDDCNSTSTSVMRTSMEDDYQPSPSRSRSSSSSSTSYLCSFCRRCCTFQHFCYVVQLFNCGLVCALIYLAVIEYPKIEALQAQVEEDKVEIAALSEEVREKQEGQIQSLHKAVEENQQFNFLTLAGTFTLLTCLISMFHMSTHVHKLNQPKIQRKIIAILWMSPIYSVTSFLTLVFPSVEGWMAIIKDFYESYCIYVFLSFLIAVLGEGSRDKAVDVLAKHASHLDRPTRCLGCFYEPPPDTSDHAKANAVMTECQIYCLQFTLIRPLTTIISVFVLHRDKTDLNEENEDYNNDDEFNDDTYDDNESNTIDGDNSDNNNDTTKNDIEYNADESSPTDATGTKQPSAASSSSSTSTTTNSTSEGNTGDDGTRTLRDTHNKRKRRSRSRRDKGLQQQQQPPGNSGMNQIEGGEIGGVTGSNPTIERSTNANEGNVINSSDDDIPTMEFPSIAPNGGGDDQFQVNDINANDDDIPTMEFPSTAPIGGGNDQFPTFIGGSNPSPATPMKGMPTTSTFAPSLALNVANALFPTLAPVVAAIAGSVNNITANIDYNNTSGIGIINSNNTDFSSVAPTMAPLLPGLNETNFDSSELVDQTKAYFKSPGFAVAMVVNVSIFFAFTGLLKLYHAVREDLLWCRPFPKFLTIKAVVFLTFWQGLAILLWLVLTAAPDEKEEAYLLAHKCQNLLICVEMLLVAISQWCVFPAIEWEPNYVPRQMHTPGLGIKDFVSDVGQIVKNRSGRSRKGRKTNRRKKRESNSNTPNSPNNAGLYHMPGTASIVSSQYDGLEGPSDVGMDTFDDDAFDESYDSSNNDDDRDEYPIEEEAVNTTTYDADRTVTFGNNNFSTQNINNGGASLSHGHKNRHRIMSGSSGKTDDEDDSDDMEFL